MNKHILFIMSFMTIFLAACQTAIETPAITLDPKPTDIPSMSTPAVTPSCPVAMAGTLLLKDDDGGYCLLYPEGHGVVIPFAGEVCLVPGEPPYMACHSASFLINVEEAGGRTADEVADTVTVESRCSEERYNLTIANEKAVVLPQCGGQATSRNVFIVHEDRLYALTFIDLSERFYAQVITSFMFLR